MINFPDIPRFYTALTESLACLLVCSSLVLSEKWSRKQFRILLIFLIQILLQLVAWQTPFAFLDCGNGHQYRLDVCFHSIAWSYPQEG